MIEGDLEGEGEKAAAAREEEGQLLEVKRELAVENLAPFAAALAREAERALERKAPAEAVARAQLAVNLAPDLPAAHLMLARARFSQSPGGVGAYFSAA